MSFFDAGKYRAVVTGQGFSESKDKKTPYFYLVIMPEVMLEQDGTETDAPLSQYESEVKWYMTKAAMEYFTRDLKTLGFTGQQPADLSPQKQGFHDFTGKVIEVICKHETYNDKMFDKWSLVFAGDTQQEERPPTDLRDLNTRFGDEFKTMFGGNKPAAQPAPRAADDMSGEPDIPF